MTTMTIDARSHERDIERIRANDPEITRVVLNPSCDPSIWSAALTALEQNTRVTHLQIGAGSTSSELMFPVADRVRGCAEVVENDEKIGPAIAHLLRCNRTITHLDYIPMYQFSNCVEQIAAGVADNETLTSFSCLNTPSSMTIDSLENTLRLIGQNRSIRSLRFDSTNFSGNRGLCLLQLVQREGTENQLQNLCLRACDISEHGIAALADVLQHHPNLEALDLGSNPIGSHLEYLRHAIRNNLSLRLLNLDNCELDCQQAALLAEIVPTSGLTSLVLSGNQIGFQGQQCLARMLAQNPTLASLSLTANQLNFQAIMQLLTSLKANSNLRLLDLHAQMAPELDRREKQEYKRLKQEVMGGARFGSLIIGDFVHGSNPYRQNLLIPIFATILFMQNKLRSMTPTMKTLLTLGLWRKLGSNEPELVAVSSLSVLPKELLMEIIDYVYEDEALPFIDETSNTRPLQLYGRYARSSFFPQNYLERTRDRNYNVSYLECEVTNHLRSVADELQETARMTKKTERALEIIRAGVPEAEATRPAM